MSSHSVCRERSDTCRVPAPSCNCASVAMPARGAPVQIVAASMTDAAPICTWARRQRAPFSRGRIRRRPRRGRCGDAGALADAVLAGVEKRVRESGRTSGVFHAPARSREGIPELSMPLQTRGAGMRLFVLSTAFFRSKECVKELFCFPYLPESAQHGEEHLPTSFAAMWPLSSYSSSRGMILPRLDECKLHVVPPSTL